MIQRSFFSFCLALFFFLQELGAQNSIPEKPIVVVIPSYNNIKWFESNLNSVLMQKYSNYRVIYINDCSSDGTKDAVENWIKENVSDFRIIEFENCFQNDIKKCVTSFSSLVNEEPHFFTFVHNKQRAGAMANLYCAIHSCECAEIIVTLDGDDWLYHENVLAELNRVYSLGEVWFTHGCLMEYPWGHVTWSEPLKEEAIEQNTFRKYKCPSHLRTFYAWLFKKIKLEDFLWKGDFFPVSWDMAIMFPFCEMARERHAYIPNVNYIYNMANPINDNKVHRELQNEIDQFIRGMPAYPRLEAAEFDCEG